MNKYNTGAVLRPFLFFLFAILLMLVSGCSNQDTHNFVPDNNLQSFDIGGENLYKDNNLSTNKQDEAARISYTIDLFTAAYDGEAEFNYESDLDAISIKFHDEGIGEELKWMAAGQMPTEDWDLLVDELVEQSKLVAEIIGPETSYIMLNPQDRTYVILEVLDGVVLYDAIDETDFYY